MTAPRFTITLQPGPHVAPYRALRAALKVLGRRYGLRCVGLQVYPAGHAVEPVRQSIARRDGDRREHRRRPARRVSATHRSNAAIAPPV
jgi:hypothetical protein